MRFTSEVRCGKLAGLGQEERLQEGLFEDRIGFVVHSASDICA